jgi:hypothetical protein
MSGPLFAGPEPVALDELAREEGGAADAGCQYLATPFNPGFWTTTRCPVKRQLLQQRLQPQDEHVRGAGAWRRKVAVA